MIQEKMLASEDFKRMELTKKNKENDKVPLHKYRH